MSTKKEEENEYESLKEYATDRQIEYLDSIIKEGSITKGAAALGLSKSTVTRGLKSMRARAASKGYSEAAGINTPVPEGFKYTGFTTLRKGDGSVALRWEMCRADTAKQLELLYNSLHDSFSSFKGMAPLVAKPKFLDENLLAVYPMGDPHFGMFAWAKETGASFDIKIAERNLKAAVDQLVQGAPPAKQAILLNLGDFFHSDTMSNRTSRSGHSLDVDTRWGKILMIGIKTMIHCILRALEKHETVIVKNLIGNHDDHTAQMLAISLNMYFHNNDRVTIDISPNKFWYYIFGKTLIGSTHGDTAKFKDLPSIMSTDVPKLWGDTIYRYWYTGHIHSQNVQEFRGCVCESFRTLATRDAWHSAEGYRSGQDMKMIVLHKEYGEIGRSTRSLHMIMESADGS